MVNVVKGGGRAPPTLTSQANFTLMTECTPESGRYHSVYSVLQSPIQAFPNRTRIVKLKGVYEKVEEDKEEKRREEMIRRV
jgi:hypothetical protein